MTLEQAKNLSVRYVYHAKATYANGTPCKMRINGKVKTWKRDPRRVYIPWKYGMYNYGAIGAHNLADYVMPEEAEVFFADQHVDKQNFFEITPEQVLSREMLCTVRGKPQSEGYCFGGCYGMQYSDIFIGIEDDGYAHS